MIKAKVISSTLGQKLRDIRRAKGVSTALMMVALMKGKYTASSISRRETGKISIDSEYLSDFCFALRLTEQESSVLKTSVRVNSLRPQSRFNESVSEWSKITLSAKDYKIYTVDVFDYYVQIKEYASALIRKHGFSNDPDKSAEMRIENAKNSFQDVSRKFRIVCHENALYMMFGGSEVMIKQLLSLLNFRDEPHVEFRILPRGSAIPVPTDSQFDILDSTYGVCENRLDFSITDDPDTVARFQSDFDTIWTHSVIGPRREEIIREAIEYYRKMG